MQLFYVHIPCFIFCSISDIKRYNCKNNGVPLLLNLAPGYLFFGKFCVFSQKLHDIFCIVCTYMIHDLHRTYIPH